MRSGSIRPSLHRRFHVLQVVFDTVSVPGLVDLGCFYVHRSEVKCLRRTMGDAHREEISGGIHGDDLRPLAVCRSCHFS